MPLDLLITLVAGFLFVALVAGYGTSALFSAWSPERRRLRQMAVGGPSGVIDQVISAQELAALSERYKQVAGYDKDTLRR